MVPLSTGQISDPTSREWFSMVHCAACAAVFLAWSGKATLPVSAGSRGRVGLPYSVSTYTCHSPRKFLSSLERSSVLQAS